MDPSLNAVGLLDSQGRGPGGAFGKSDNCKALMQFARSPVENLGCLAGRFADAAIPLGGNPLQEIKNIGAHRLDSNSRSN